MPLVDEPTPKSVASTPSVRGFASRFIDQLVLDVGGPLGYGFTLLILLGWCVAYPSLLALPLLLWAIWQLLLYYRGEAEEHKPHVALYWLVRWCFAILVAEYIVSIYSIWKLPEVFLKQDSPFSTAAVQGLFGEAIQ